MFEDHVYWSTQDKGEVFRQDKFGRGTKTKLLTGGPWLTQVSVYQQQRYNSVASKQPASLHITPHNCSLSQAGAFFSPNPRLSDFRFYAEKYISCESFVYV